MLETLTVLNKSNRYTLDLEEVRFYLTHKPFIPNGHDQ